jgi:hypothetical protein
MGEFEIMKEWIFILVILIIMIVGLPILALLGDYLLEKTECSKKADVLGYNHEFGFFEGCVLVLEDGSKLLLKQLREDR